MTILEYLDMVCKYESEAYGTKLKIQKKQEEIERTRKEVVETVDNFKKSIRVKKKTLNELSEEYECDVACKPDTHSTVIAWLALMGVTAVVLLAIKGLVMGLLGAENYVQTFKWLAIIYGVVVAIVWLVVSVIDLFEWSKTLISFGCWCGVTILTLIYFLICESNGISVTNSFWLVMKVFLALEFIIGGIYCIYSYCDNNSYIKQVKKRAITEKKRLKISRAKL